MQPCGDQSERNLRNSLPWLSLGSIALLALTLVSCLPWQWDYLVEATGRATQEEITEQFGAPIETKNLEGEGSLWIYRYEVKGGWLIGRRGDMVGGAPCMEYRLTFDSKKVLRYWTRQPCGMVQGGGSLPATYEKSMGNADKF
jgi:hypothetical protein